MRKFIYNEGQADEMVYYARPNKTVKDEKGNDKVIEDNIIPNLIEQGYKEKIEKTK